MKYTKQKDGLYRAKIYLCTENGKPKYKYVRAKSEKELNTKVDKIKKALAKGLNGEEDLSFNAVADMYLTDRKSQISQADYNTLVSRLDYFRDYIGKELITKIKKSDIQLIIDELAKENPTTGKPTARRTVVRYLTAIRNVFENAIENRLIEYNPCNYVNIPKGLEQKERRALTDTERQWVENTPHRAQLPAMLMIYSGLRKGEATALLWSDVNLDEGTITVNKSYDFKSNCIKPPKTKAGYRVINIPQKLVDYLREQEHTCEYVVHTADNRRMTFSAWRGLWNSYILTLDLKYGKGKKNGKFDPKEHIITIDPFTIHECRHSFCTLMYLAGVDILTAQQQMGHSDVKTTLSIYSHLDSIYKKKNISKLDTFLEG